MKREVISEQGLEALILRLQEAIENDLSITKEDMNLLLKVLLSFSYIQDKLTDSDITLKKLRKLAGIISASEKFKDVIPDVVVPKSKEKVSKLESVEKKEKKEVKHKTEHHKIKDLNKGETCPDCNKGKLYKYEPGIFVRIIGQAPLSCTKHILEKLRCNACLKYFTAEVPEEVKADGNNKEMYGYSAKALMSIYRYFGGLPFYRQESLNYLFGMPVSASTVFENCEQVANAANPIFNYLKKLSANGKHYNLDDTTNKILDSEKIMIPNRITGKLKERSGVYTSGMIVKLSDNNKVILFKTNIGHAGEFIDEILLNRNENTSPPIIMSDALKSNLPTVIKNYELSLCNAHARRGFVDVIEHFPDKVKWVLEKYSKIWQNENKCKEFSLLERMNYHKENSLPSLEEIRIWGKIQLDNNDVEENSGLGKSIKYFIKHFQHLTAFCNIEGAKIDNNEMESTLKLIIRGRKNSLFFKTQIGAGIADILTSVIATCNKFNANSFEYLIILQRYSEKVKQNPELWLPWNYENTIKNLKSNTS